MHCSQLASIHRGQQVKAFLRWNENYSFAFLSLIIYLIQASYYVTHLCRPYSNRKYVIKRGNRKKFLAGRVPHPTSRVSQIWQLCPYLVLRHSQVTSSVEGLNFGMQVLVFRLSRNLREFVGSLTASINGKADLISYLFQCTSIVFSML